MRRDIGRLYKSPCRAHVTPARRDALGGWRGREDVEGWLEVGGEDADGAGEVGACGEFFGEDVGDAAGVDLVGGSAFAPDLEAEAVAVLGVEGVLGLLDVGAAAGGPGRFEGDQADERLEVVAGAVFEDGNVVGVVVGEGPVVDVALGEDPPACPVGGCGEDAAAADPDERSVTCVDGLGHVLNLGASTGW